MLKYDKIDAPEGINNNKTDGLRECIICYYWYLLKISLRFQPKVCDGFHDMTQKSMSFDTVIVSVKAMIIELIFGLWLKNRL